MDKFVFDAIVEEVKYTEEQYIKTCIDSLLCPRWMKPLREKIASTVIPAKVSFSVAYDIVFASMKNDTRQCHLRRVPEIVMETSNVKISPTVMVSQDDSEKKVFQQKNGYFVPEGRNVDIVGSWTADAVAFQLTDTSSYKKGTAEATGVMGCSVTPKFQVDKKMATQSFSGPVPKQWTNSATVNSESIWDTSVQGKPEEIVKYHASFCSQLDPHGVRLVSGVSVDPMILKYGTLKGAKYEVPAPCMVVQNTLTVAKEVDFYRVLQEHRVARGADKDTRSILTSGYYIGSMSRQMDQMFWILTDILHMMKIHDASLLYMNELVNYNLIYNLIANGIYVSVGTDKYLGSVKFGTHRTELVTYYGGMIYMDRMFGDSTPTVNKKMIVASLPKHEFEEIFKAFVSLPGPTRFTHVYLRDYMTEYVEYILPSVHAHAGHVMIANKKVNTNVKAINVPNLFRRACMANKYKTAFPVRRAIFYHQDEYAPEFIQHGVVMVKGSATTKASVVYDSVGKVDIQQTAFDDFPEFIYESKITPPVPHFTIVPDPHLVSAAHVESKIIEAVINNDESVINDVDHDGEPRDGGDGDDEDNPDDDNYDDGYDDYEALT